MIGLPALQKKCYYISISPSNFSIVIVFVSIGKAESQAMMFGLPAAQWYNPVRLQELFELLLGANKTIIKHDCSQYSWDLGYGKKENSLLRTS